MVQVHYPGVTIYMPLTEDGDEAAVAAKARLTLLWLFLPVCLRADVVWKECVARMGQESYLQHPCQTGVKIAKQLLRLRLSPPFLPGFLTRGTVYDRTRE